MTVCLDKSLGGTALCEKEFNMADFFYNEYKPIRLYLEQCEANQNYPLDPEETYIDIGLKGTNEDGLVEKRMNLLQK